MKENETGNAVSEKNGSARSSIFCCLKGWSWRNFAITAIFIMVLACIVCAGIPEAKNRLDNPLVSGQRHATVSVELFAETLTFENACIWTDRRFTYVNCSDKGWSSTRIYRNENVIAIRINDGIGWEKSEPLSSKKEDFLLMRKLAEKRPPRGEVEKSGSEVLK